mgnify:CR=1 FL=1|jgi:uncharacterized protein (TIGR02147 family)
MVKAKTKAKKISVPNKELDNIELDVFQYTDYRLFLKDFVEEQKRTSQHFSMRYFARVAGTGSPGYLIMIMKGQRNLSTTYVNKFIKALRFSKKEADYFEAMVNFNQAKEDKERDQYFDRMLALKPSVRIRGLQKDQLAFYSKKHFVVIHQMVSLPEFKEDAEWIAGRLYPSIRASEAQQAIDILLRLGLLKRGKKGKLEQAHSTYMTSSDVDSIYVYAFHRYMIAEAKNALMKGNPNFKDITSVTIPVPKSKMKELKERIQEFREETMDWITKYRDEYDEVYQMNVQLFPLTKKKAEK